MITSFYIFGLNLQKMEAGIGFKGAVSDKLSYNLEPNILLSQQQ